VPLDYIVTVVPGSGFETVAPSLANSSATRTVAVADFNGDGKADVAGANELDNNVSILLGNGDGTFQAPVKYNAGSSPQSVAVGDFNGDGKPDLVVTNTAGANMSVLLGNGDGTFQEAISYGAGSEPTFVVVGDFNGDGKADLATANYGSNNVSVLLGNGDGTFKAAVSYASGAGSVAVAVGDFNGDGVPDLVAANYGGNVGVLLGNGDGTFQTVLNYAAGNSPYDLTVGDFNGDGKTDVAVANYAGNNVSVLLGNGKGAFAAEVYYAAGGGPISIASGDFNGDGKPDLAVANLVSNNVSLLIGNGDGTFRTAVNYLAGPGPTYVAVGGFNADGVEDLVVADYLAGIHGVGVLLGTAVSTAGPSVISVSPIAGSGNSATFTAQFSAPAGVWAIATAALLVNTTTSPVYGCQVTYSTATNQFALANDVGSASTMVNPGGGVAQNDQCILNGSGSYVTTAGNVLTLVVSLTFQPGFTGSETVYLSASDTSGNTTGVVSKGTWVAVAATPSPSATSVSPASSTGSSQTFTFVFSDTQNALNITGMAMLFNTSVSFTNACYIIVDRGEGTIALAWDSALGSNSKPISSTATLSNSQCTVGAASIAVSGLSNIVTVAVTFKGAFSGLKNISMFGSENGVYETGWVQMGTYTVAAGGIPIAASVLPSSGTAASQRFSFTVSDQGGAGFLTGAAALISSSLSSSSACYVVWDRTAGTISLAYDNPSKGASPVTPGNAQEVVSNSQCTLKASDSTVAIGATSIVITVDLSFNANYFGAKNVYLEAVEPGVNSGWVAVGTWTVSAGAPVANSVSPPSGSGATPTLTFTVSDAISSSNISGMSVLIDAGSPTLTAGACYLEYNAINSTIALFNDAGTASSSKSIGSSTTLSNSQCAVGYTDAYPSGSSVVLNVNLAFTAAFAGSKTVYLDALEPAASSGWVPVGAWNVP
jgi:hypothetical protein